MCRVHKPGCHDSASQAGDWKTCFFGKRPYLNEAWHSGPTETRPAGPTCQGATPSELGPPRV